MMPSLYYIKGKGKEQTQVFFKTFMISLGYTILFTQSEFAMVNILAA